MTTLSETLLHTFATHYRNTIRTYLSDFPPLSTMLGYQMGWNDSKGIENLTSGGKQLRPLIAMLSCGAMDANPDNALALGSAIELIHTFSLIHDDVMDVSETRRGRPSVWKVWGVNQAINAGDGAYGLSFQFLADAEASGLDPIHLLRAGGLLGKACVDTVQGQMMDVSFEDRDLVSVEEYTIMTSLKTGPLIGLALGGGALLAGADAETVKALDKIGRQLGVAFQLQDDILGVWGNPDETGKSASDDITQKKKAFPMLWSLENLPEAERQVLTELYALPAPLSEEVTERVRDILTRNKVQEVVEAEALAHYDQVVEGLKAHYPDNDYRDELLKIVAFIVNRNF